MSAIPIETERKFLIRIPSLTKMQNGENFRIREITQTYLDREGKKNARVRAIVENGKTTYIKTVKERISQLSCLEEENEISKEEYEKLLLCADKEKNSIHKTRYSFEYGKHTLEIDVYEFWNDRATLEIELESEDEGFSIPSFVEVIKEISTDGKYKNTNLAKNVPYDQI